MIWCEACSGANGDDLHDWVRDGVGTTKTGLLKREAECRSCGAVLSPGTAVEAITLFTGERHFPWEREFLVDKRRFFKGSRGNDGTKRSQESLVRPVRARAR